MSPLYVNERTHPHRLCTSVRFLVGFFEFTWQKRVKLKLWYFLNVIYSIWRSLMRRFTSILKEVEREWKFVCISVVHFIAVELERSRNFFDCCYASLLHMAAHEIGWLAENTQKRISCHSSWWTPLPAKSSDVNCMGIFFLRLEMSTVYYKLDRSVRWTWLKGVHYVRRIRYCK